MDAFDAVVEILMWAGLGAGVLALIVAVGIRLADGTWMPTSAVLEDGETGRVARWFGHDGVVGEAPLTPEQERALAGVDAADVYTRPGVPDRIRLTKGSPAARAVALLGIGLVLLGTAAAVASLVALFAAG